MKIYGRKFIGIGSFFLFTIWLLYVFVYGKPNGYRPLLVIFALIAILIISYSPYKKQADRLVAILFPVSLTVTSVFYIASIPNESFVASAGGGAYLLVSDFFVFYMLLRWSVSKGKRANDTLAIVAFVVWSVITIIYATDQTYAIDGALQFCKCLVIFLWFSSTYKVDFFQKYFLLGLEFAVIYQSTIAILQKVNGGAIGLGLLGESTTAFRERLISGVTETGVAGTFIHSSNLALFILFAICFIGVGEYDKYKKYFIIGLSLIAIWLASSRTALVILAFCFVYLFWKNRKKYFNINGVLKILLLVSVIGIVCMVSLRMGSFDKFIDSDFQLQIINRTVHWEIAWSYIYRNWFWGYGVNNFTATLNSLAGALTFFHTNPVHNVYLLYWFEMGIVGFVLYVYLLMKNAAKIKNFKVMEPMQKGAILVIICVIAYNFTGWACSTVPAIYFLWIAIGLLNNWDRKLEICRNRYIETTGELMES